MKRTIKRSLIEATWPRLKNINNFPMDVSLSIDSRTLEPGDVFFAIPGEHSDGHDFINQAMERGAALIVAEHTYKGIIDPSLPILFVNNSLKALSELAHSHLRSMSCTKIAITGSNGKTTTKEMVKALLCYVFGDDAVYASAGNRNNHFGVPLSALEVLPTHRFAIFELGMNHAGEIKELAEIVEPDIGVITNIGHAHEGNFPDGIEGVALAKGELFENLAQRSGVAVVNQDDERVVAMAQRYGVKNSVCFGSSTNADICLREYGPNKRDPLQQHVVVHTQSGDLTYHIPLLGSHHALNSAAALAVLVALKVPLNKSIEGFLCMKKTAGRLVVHKTSLGVTLIDDGYNANPTSMKAGIEASLMIQGQRRIAVIGAMGELGAKSAQHHEALGHLLAQHFDQLFLCGPDAQFAVKGALNEGFKSENILYKDSSVLLIEPLKNMIRPGDVIFVKGSLSANMKAVVDALIT